MRLTRGASSVVSGARPNGDFWLCAHHDHRLIFATLRAGQPVVEAIKGEPKFLLMPTSGISKNR